MKPTVRLYDWGAAVLVADFILVSISVMLLEQSWLMKLFGAVSLIVWYDIWNVYCKWRLSIELDKNNDK